MVVVVDRTGSLGKLFLLPYILYFPIETPPPARPATTGISNTS